MVAGSLGYEDRLMNEYGALLEGMKEAYYKDYKNIILETSHGDAYWNWYNSSVLGGLPIYVEILHQLNQRKADKNFKNHVRLVDEEDNMLAAYLARHGAERWNRMVVIREMFGRTRELWMLDMGLGTDEEIFQVVFEEEMDLRRLMDEVLDPEFNDEAGDEMDVGDENHVVVVGLAAAVNPNGELGNGPGDVQVEVEADEGEANGIGANVNPGASSVRSSDVMKKIKSHSVQFMFLLSYVLSCVVGPFGLKSFDD